jgi:16S rRNA (uracil1498-N3)-methyltransferase
MLRLFVDGEINGLTTVTGEDAKHVKVLRMRPGETLTLCDGKGKDYDCVIDSFSAQGVRVRVLGSRASSTEPSVRVTLFQCLPKADAMDRIIQKSVELGVYRIIPVISSRCVSTPDEKALQRKIIRWSKISAEAAKQCGRGIIPKVGGALPFRRAARELARLRCPLMFYEENGGIFSQAFSAGETEIGILTGPEGGFEKEEVELARSLGVKTAGLGPRILRAETAPVCALSAIMAATGNI